MRKIKFRRYDTINKIMLSNKDIPILLKNVKDDNQFKYMQYTGLKDKNGKEIYEGDIVRILYTDWPSQPAEKNGRYKLSLEDYKKSISYYGEIIYTTPKYVIDFHKKYNSCGSIIPGTHGEIEIIGNKYENPELLK